MISPSKARGRRRKMDAELVVMGTHGRRDWRRPVLDSVAERFLRISACPVLLVLLRGQQDAPTWEYTREPQAPPSPDVTGAAL